MDAGIPSACWPHLAKSRQNNNRPATTSRWHLTGHCMITGKVAIPDSDAAFQTGRLTEEGMKIMKTRAAIGADTGWRPATNTPMPNIARWRDLTRTHHEQYDRRRLSGRFGRNRHPPSAAASSPRRKCLRRAHRQMLRFRVMKKHTRYDCAETAVPLPGPDIVHAIGRTKISGGCTDDPSA